MYISTPLGINYLQRCSSFIPLVAWYLIVVEVIGFTSLHIGTLGVGLQPPQMGKIRGCYKLLSHRKSHGKREKTEPQLLHMPDGVRQLIRRFAMDYNVFHGAKQPSDSQTAFESIILFGQLKDDDEGAFRTGTVGFQTSVFKCFPHLKISLKRVIIKFMEQLSLIAQIFNYIATQKKSLFVLANT